jgi:hypothetical protein
MSEKLIVDTETDIIRFKALNRRLFIAATIVIAAIAAVILVYAIIIFSGVVKSSTVLIALLLSWSPCPFYLWALWTLRSLFGQLSRGGPSLPLKVTSALSRIGWALMLGATLTLALTPLIDRFSKPHRMGNFAVFDVPALTLGLVGLALLMVGTMLKRAIRIEAEAKALKDVLEGFI